MLNGKITKLCLENKRAIQRFNKKTKIKWVKKNEICLISHIALKAMNECFWYLDSTCSSHMSGNKPLFDHIEPTNGEIVTFGDGSKVTVEGKGSINFLGVFT